jgi:NAD(P)-dependent dehydrogenase (short-subunit alcohol dehydrogenase family)
METNIDFNGLRVAITGGTSGLGLALVRRLAAEGARIAFVARSGPAVEGIANETGTYGIVGDVGCKHDIYAISVVSMFSSTTRLVWALRRSRSSATRNVKTWRKRWR